MTVIDIRTKMENKYNSANKLKPVVEEILEKNKEGLDLNQILRSLEELGKYYEGIKKDLKVLLRLGGFEKNKSNKHKIIYRIQNS